MSKEKAATNINEIVNNPVFIEHLEVFIQGIPYWMGASIVYASFYVIMLAARPRKTEKSSAESKNAMVLNILPVMHIVEFVIESSALTAFCYSMFKFLHGDYFNRLFLDEIFIFLAGNILLITIIGFRLVVLTKEAWEVGKSGLLDKKKSDKQNAATQEDRPIDG